MNPQRVDRQRLLRLTDLPNIGPAMAADLQRLGFERPDELRGHDAYALYDRLEKAYKPLYEIPPSTRFATAYDLRYKKVVFEKKKP